MSYQNLNKLLPKALIEQLQQYIEGRVIYVPKRKSSKKAWGENTSTKKILSLRNATIYQDFLEGLSVKELSEKYFLAEKSIQRILRQEKY